MNIIPKTSVGTWLITSAEDLRTAVRAAKSAARDEASEGLAPGYKLFDRDTDLLTCNEGGRCSPRDGGSGWDGSWKSVCDLVDEVVRDYPEATEVHLDGGFDAAESKTLYDEGDYEPCVGEWGIKIWERAVAKEGVRVGWYECRSDKRVSVLFEGTMPVRVSVTLADGEEMEDGRLEELLDAECNLGSLYNVTLAGLGSPAWEPGEADGEMVCPLKVVER